MKQYKRFFPTGVGLATFASLSTMAAGAMTAGAIAQDLNCNSPQTQAEMNYCSGLDYEKADRKLNQVYQRLQPELTTANRQYLVNAQRAWIKFRDSDCELARSQFEGGSIAPLIQNTCLTEATDQRTRHLGIYYSGLVPQAVGGDYPNTDRWLNETYQEVRDSMQEAMRNRLIEAQLAWIKFRDENCQFEEAYVSSSQDNCLTRMTAQRTLELSSFIERTP